MIEQIFKEREMKVEGKNIHFFFLALVSTSLA